MLHTLPWWRDRTGPVSTNRSMAVGRLWPQKGYKDLFGSDDIPYSVFANLILAY